MYSELDKRLNGQLTAYINELIDQRVLPLNIPLYLRRRFGYLFPDMSLKAWADRAREYYLFHSSVYYDKKSFANDCYLEDVREQISSEAVALFKDGHNLVSITRRLYGKYGKSGKNKTVFTRDVIEDISARSVLDYVNAENRARQVRAR